MYKKDNSNNPNVGISTFLIGAALGALAVVMSDRRLRNRTLDFIEGKKSDTETKLMKISSTAKKKKEEITDRALDIADRKLSQKKAEVERKKEKRRALKDDE